MSATIDHGALQLVLFDLDGTLADTFKDIYWALNQALAEHGHGAADAQATRALVSHGARAMAHAALPHDKAQLVDVEERFLAIYEQHVATRTTLFDGIEHVLATLEQAGIGYGVVTNKRGRFSKPLIEQLDLSSRLRCLVSGDDAARAKPHPDPLLLAAQLCNVPTAHCLYVGDAHNDVIAAQAARMRVAVATYGYLGADDQPHLWNADLLVSHPSQLNDWLVGSLHNLQSTGRADAVKDH